MIDHCLRHLMLKSRINKGEKSHFSHHYGDRYLL